MAPKETDTPQGARTPQHAEGVHVQRPKPAAHRTTVSVDIPQQPVADTEPAAASSELYLPPQVISKSDVSRCLRELQGLDDYFHQASIRGSKVEQLPKISQVLESLAQANGLNLLHPESRTKLKPFLTRVKSRGPVVHMSFPSVAGNQFIGKILEWFRKEAHPHVMLHIGLQPELAAGFTVRTTNKAFDFSFRKRFEQSKQKLITALEKMDKAPEKTIVAASTDTVAPEAQL